MTVRIKTEYNHQHHLGPGFYNTVVFEDCKNNSPSIGIGPYASRPLARKDGARLLGILEKETA